MAITGDCIRVFGIYAESLSVARVEALVEAMTQDQYRCCGC